MASGGISGPRVRRSTKGHHSKRERPSYVEMERVRVEEEDKSAMVLGILGLLLMVPFSIMAVCKGSPGSVGRQLGVVGVLLFSAEFVILMLMWWVSWASPPTFH